MANTQAFDLAAVLADAQRRESLSDWGPAQFERPLEVLLADYAAADLNAIGVLILRAGIVHSLRMRLRAHEWIRRYPEILQERVVAPVVVVGMMRSGTTLLQRLLAADPRFQCAYGWEVVEAAPALDYPFVGVDPRITVSEGREAKSRELAPDFSPSIRCMRREGTEEEIVFLADAFLSHVPESGAHLPNYRSWPDAQDFTPATAYSAPLPQFLQWQKRRCGVDAGSAGVKSPAHLGYLGATAGTVRRPAHRAHAPRPARHDRLGSRALTPRCTRCMPTPSTSTGRRAVVAADGLGPTTARWRSGTAGPMRRTGSPTSPDRRGCRSDRQVTRVYDAIGLALTVDAETAMRRWLEERPRETARPPYGLADYGLRPEQVDERFTQYNKRFEQYVGK